MRVTIADGTPSFNSTNHGDIEVHGLMTSIKTFVSVGNQILVGLDWLEGI